MMKNLFLILALLVPISSVQADQLFKGGGTSKIINIAPEDMTKTSTDANIRMTGLTNASSGLVIASKCNNEAAETTYTVAGSNVETVTTLGTYQAPSASKARFKETTTAGVYEIHLADARFAVSGADSCFVEIRGVTNMRNALKEYPILAATPDVNVASTSSGAITATSLASDTITAAKIAPDSIGASEIADGAIDAATLASDTITAAKIADGAIDAATLASDTITAAKIAADSIGSSELAADAIGASEIAADAIGASEVAADAGTEIGTAVWATTVRDLTVKTGFSLTQAFPTNFSSMVISGAGVVNGNTTTWNGTAVAAPNTAGYPIVTIKNGTGSGEVALSSGTVSATIPTGGITDTTIATAGANKIADHVWRRNSTNIEASSNGDTIAFQSPYGMVAQQTNNTNVSGSSLVVKYANGSTTFATRSLTSSAGASPITGISN